MINGCAKEMSTKHHRNENKKFAFGFRTQNESTQIHTAYQHAM